MLPLRKLDQRGRNSIARQAATWLRRGIALGRFAPQVRTLWAVIDGTQWLVDIVPKIRSYLDEPKTLEELQRAVGEPGAGYERHHIVEGQYGSDDPLANPTRFGRDRLENPENLVRVPYWKHVEISSWYSKPDTSPGSKYGGMSPRDYLRGKSWREQYETGLDALRAFGVLT